MEVLKQLGAVNMSKHHLVKWHVVEHPTLDELLINIISPTKFVSRESGVKTTGHHNFFVIDWDGDKKGYKKTIERLRVSWLAFPSPSHWDKLKVGEYRMRILIPVSGSVAASHDGYQAQYLAMLHDLKLPMPDKTAADTKRYFYPPMMKGIGQPKSANAKPTNQKLKKVCELVSVGNGSRYKVKTVKEAMIAAQELFPKLYKQTDSGKYEKSRREVEIIDGSTVITHRGRPIIIHGKKCKTFKKIAAKDVHVRCDCPFKGHENHAKKGRDYAFIQGNRIICESNSHGHLVGRLPDELLGRRL